MSEADIDRTDFVTDRRLDRVSRPELLEVQLVNAIAPFLINSRLKP
ncbi:hypothetical protein [Chamaesiphon minutus]|nr:hypothetical protein [Chamaesiphon minutus]